MQKSEFSIYYNSTEHRKFFENFLSRLPDEMFSYLRIKKFQPQDRIISSAVRSEVVYFLMKGRVYAIDERIQNQQYVFTELHPVEIIGDFELFSEMKDSYATIVAADDCECISIPANMYLKWISQNAQPLFYRTKLLMKLLGNQTASGRQYFYMDYEPRCISILLQHAVLDKSGVARINITREELSGKIGCSIRTCHRIIRELTEKEWISISHGKISVDSQQLIWLKRYLDSEITKL